MIENLQFNNELQNLISIKFTRNYTSKTQNRCTPQCINQHIQLLRQQYKIIKFNFNFSRTAFIFTQKTLKIFQRIRLKRKNKAQDSIITKYKKQYSSD